MTPCGATSTAIVLGQALQLSLQCLGGDTLHILCIYAPTTGTIQQCKDFFREVQEYYKSHTTILRLHIMAGDFNNIEDKIVRLPVGEPPDSSIKELDTLKRTLSLSLIDG